MTCNENNNIHQISKGTHFYWTQKSSEIAKDIYLKNCKDGDNVLDPFLGAGSSLYGIRDLNLKFIGVEINEYPYRIAKFNIKNITDEAIEDLKKQVLEIKENFNHIYHYKINSSLILEFQKVIFNNIDGIEIQKIFFQDLNGNKFTSDDYPETIDMYLNNYKSFNQILQQLENPLLIKNSRIAVKNKMYLSDIFSPISFYILLKIKEEIKNDHILKFVLGSCLHLCKLTDTKSQSQFPYWIPKSNIVERNIFLTILNKIKALKNSTNLCEIKEVNKFSSLKKISGSACLLFNKPIQHINEDDIPDCSIDFILTDPPYFDQVAYSEYLKIWEFFLDYKSVLTDEIVVSQRETEQTDEKTYLENIEKAFLIAFKKLKPNAKMYVYFKDSRLDKMGMFLQILDRVGFQFLGQEYFDNAKYTYKQNTTTKTTIKGECILKFKKTCKETLTKDSFILPEDKTNKLISKFCESYLLVNEKATLGEFFNNGLVKLLYDHRALHLLKKSNEVVNILNEICIYNEIDRSYSLKNRKYSNKLLLGDCLNILKSIPSATFNCCITDPPYNISGYDHKKEIGWYKSNAVWQDKKSFKKIDEKWDKFSDDDYESFTFNWLQEVKRVVKPNGNIVVFGSYHNIYKIGYCIEKLDLKIINSIVWYKRNAFPNITQRMFCESTEHIIWATNNNKKDAKNWTFNYKEMKELNGGVQMRNLFDVPITKTSEKEFGKHPSQKPLAVLNYLILALTNENDIILDPFIGSGTTGVSALQNKRNFMGIENNYEYLALAEKRLEMVEPPTPTTKKNVKQAKLFE